jgi:CheY-like chemotaxis protein
VTDTPRPDAPLVLVVDDVEDARYLYSVYLTTHGFRVIEPANGEDAIRLA